MEIQTDYSKQLGIGITSFDIELDETFEKNIRGKTFDQLGIFTDKHKIVCAIQDADGLIGLLDQPGAITFISFVPVVETM